MRRYVAQQPPKKYSAVLANSDRSKETEDRRQKTEDRRLNYSPGGLILDSDF
jgi:hypothetical protein